MFDRFKLIFKEIISNIDVLSILKTLYVSLSILAPILSNRIIGLFGLPILMASFSQQFNFGVLDLINYNYGAKQARIAVIATTVTRIIVWGVIGLLMLLPTFSETKGFNIFIGEAFRFTIAGLITTLVSQYFVDIPIFDWVKRKLNSGFALRYNISNFFSSMLTVILFHLIAFVGTDKPILNMILMSYGIQTIILISLTPLWSGINKLIQIKEN